jgi:hypothetical protein
LSFSFKPNNFTKGKSFDLKHLYYTPFSDSIKGLAFKNQEDGTFYSTPLNFDDFAFSLATKKAVGYSKISVISDCAENEESYQTYKQLLSFFSSSNALLLTLNSKISFPHSYITILNNFRGNFEDFTLWKDATLNYANLLYLGGEDFF